MDTVGIMPKFNQSANYSNKEAFFLSAHLLCIYVEPLQENYSYINQFYIMFNMKLDWVKVDCSDGLKLIVVDRIELDWISIDKFYADVIY